MTGIQVFTAGGIDAKALSFPGHSSGFGKHGLISQLTQFASEHIERTEDLAEDQSRP